MAKSGIGDTFGIPISAVGIPWYEEADYPAILAVMTDAQVLPGTFSGWLQRAEEMERKLASQGHKTVRVIIKPQAFAGWCAVRGRANIDANARMAFASEEAARQVGR